MAKSEKYGYVVYLLDKPNQKPRKDWGVIAQGTNLREVLDIARLFCNQYLIPNHVTRVGYLNGRAPWSCSAQYLKSYGNRLLASTLTMNLVIFRVPIEQE